MGKTILVTGGAGFIGSNFVSHRMARHPDDAIVVVDALTYAGSMDNLPRSMAMGEDPKHQFWYGNVCNAHLMESLVAEADVVVHFAAESHVTRSIYDNRLFFETDVMGAQTVANAVLKNKGSIDRFIHISTSEVYGTAVGDQMDEKHPLDPMSPYAAAKCGADRLVFSYWATYQIPAVIIRPFNNYGPRQHLEKVLPRFITSVLLDEPLTVHGDGSAARDFVFVEDVCRAIDMTINADLDKVAGETFNVATGGDRTVLSLAQDVTRLMGGGEAKPEIAYRGDRPGQVNRHTGDASKIKRVLGWEPEVTWEEGLQRTIDWYKENRAIWEKQMWMRTIPITSAGGKVEQH